jgi:hypothetical protein
MAAYLNEIGDPGLSALVCGLVREVRHVVRNGRDAREVSELKGRIGQLRQEIGGTPNAPVHRYLDALQMELGAA